MADYISTNKRELVLGLEGFSDVTPDTVLTLNGNAVIKDDLKFVFGNLADFYIQKASSGSLTISGAAGSNPGDTLTPLVINQTWNAGTDVVTGLSFNVTDTASGADSHLLDITIGGESAFMIDKDISSASGTTIRTRSGVLTLARNTDGRVRHIFGTDSHIMKTSTGGTGIELNTPTSGVLELGERGSSRNQTFRIYRTDYSTANYERGYLSWISDTVFALGTEADGTATASQMELQTAGTTRVTLTTDGIVRIPDNGKLTAGTSDDLQTYHDGTNSYIENATGDLYIRALTGEESIVTVPNAEVAAYYDNVRKVETTPTGIEVFGIVEADNITEHKILNDISSLFNGVTTQFTISTGSPAENFVNAEIPSESRLLISVGGIVQEPDPGQIKGYYISGGTNASTDPIKINFIEAPKANQAFFGVAFGLSFEPPNAFVTKEQAISYSIVFGGI